MSQEEGGSTPTLSPYFSGINCNKLNKLRVASYKVVMLALIH